jgi:MFS superfamily sulfate permease-like transporter
MIDEILDFFSDLWENTTEVFSNLGEISTYGIVFGLSFCIFIFFTKKWMLDSFTKYMKPGTGFIIQVLTFVVGFILGYFIGKGYEDTA